MRLKEALTEALELIKKEPALATMQTSKAAAAAATKALEKFIADARSAMLTKNPDYIRIAALVDKMSKKPDGAQRVKEACKAAGLMTRVPTGDDLAAKIAEAAINEKRTKALLKHLNQDPDTVLRDELIAVAAEAPGEIRDALKRLLTETKADKYAKAAGFEVVRETVKTGKKKGTKRVNRDATVDNAMVFLAPYIESMADTHS